MESEERSGGDVGGYGSMAKAFNGDTNDMNSPLMAGGGDSVARVILLSFPQTGTGRRYEALVSMFQQAGRKTQVIPHVSVWCHR